ncbi:hypothetical protein D3C87_942320 [compost metagenome]
MHRGTGHPLDVRLAEGALDETGDAVALAGADQRADLIIGITFAGEAQAADGGAEFGDQFVVNPGLRVDPTGSGAVLPGVVVTVSAHAIDHGLDVGVVADDHRGFAAEFEVRAFQGFRSGLKDFLSGDDIAGQRHHAHFSVADQMAANAFAATADDVDDPAREDFGQRWRQSEDRQRRVFGRFEHQRVAGGEGRGDFPRGHHDRVVPRRNRGDHANRIATHHAGVARQVFAAELTGLAAHGASEETEHIDGRRQIVLTRQVQRLAAVQRFEAGEVVGVFFHGVGDLEQQVRTLLRRGARPLGKCAVGGEDGGFDLLGAGFGDVREDFAGGRIENRLDKTFPGDQFAVNQQRGTHRGLRASHFPRSLFLCGHCCSLKPGADRLIDAARLVRGSEVDKY